MTNFSASPTLNNCTFWGNWAEWGGGGIYNYDSASPTLTNCTFWNNTADHNGGGINNELSAPTVTNCILWGDAPDEIYNISSIPVVSYSDIDGGHPGLGNISLDPMFVDAANGDFHLSLGSPCIDVGNNDAQALPDFDFEGDDRILDGDGNVTAVVDMGVDEVAIDWPYFHVYLPQVFRNY
jgi:parallel beta-helix repeat protein